MNIRDEYWESFADVSLGLININLRNVIYVIPRVKTLFAGGREFTLNEESWQSFCRLMQQMGHPVDG